VKTSEYNNKQHGVLGNKPINEVLIDGEKLKQNSSHFPVLPQKRSQTTAPNTKLPTSNGN
jgi:hypothetical protein